MQSVDGAMWFGTSNGVSRLGSDGNWTTYTAADGLANDNVISMIQSDDGSMWFGTFDGGVTHLDSTDYWTTYTTKDGLSDNTIYTIFQSSDMALWFGTHNGVSRRDKDGHWATFTTRMA